MGNLEPVAYRALVDDHPQGQSASNAPSPEAIAADLAGMLRTGVTTKSCRTAQALLGLTIVAAKSASDDVNDRAVAATTLIREACAAVDDTPSGPSATLLALAPGLRGSLLKQRRAAVAEALGWSLDHLRRERQDDLIEAVANELYAMDSAYRLRHQHRDVPPERSSLRIDWLEQHRSYRRIWTPVTGIRNDLAVLLEYFEDANARDLTPYDLEGDEQANVSDRLCTMSWHLARYSTAMNQFVDEKGGLWLLSSPEAEIRVGELVHQMEVLLPFGEADVSWLRMLLGQARDGECEPFVELLIEAGDQRRELMVAWVDWAFESVGKTTDPDLRPSGCGQWLAAGDEFVHLIDDDWFRVADWYSFGDNGPR